MMKNLYCVAALTLICSSVANAGIQVYSSESNWMADTHTWTSVNLENIASFDSSIYLGSPGSIEVDGIEFATSTQDSSSFVIGDEVYSPWANFSSQQGTDNGTTIEGLAGSTSFALFVGTFDATNPIQVTLSNGDSTSVSGFDLNSEFVGFTDADPFDWVNLTQYNGAGINVGPVAYGSSDFRSVPGPAAILPFAMGLIALRRRK